MEIISTPYVLHENNKQAGKVFGKESIEVMNIQLKAGEEIPTHHADANVLIIVKNGVVSFTVEGQETELTNEKILHMNPLENHSLRAIEDADVVVVKVK